MKKKYLTLGFCLLAILMPMILFGQTTQDYSNTLGFFQGEGSFEDWFMKAFTTLDVTMQQRADEVALFGRAIGGLGCMIYLGTMGWQMISGDRDWEIVPMLRPFFIGLILTYWSAFTGLISLPLLLLAQPSATTFESIEKDADALRVKVFEKQSKLLDYAVAAKAKEMAKQKQIEDAKPQDGGILSGVSDAMVNLDSAIYEWQTRMNFELQKLIGDLMQVISLAILRVCVYLMFFIQKIWMYILEVLGPIAIGMAMIPGFENSFNNWVSKYINVNLYTFITYTIINIGQQLIMSAYTMQINRLDTLAPSGTFDDPAVLQFVAGNGFLFITLQTIVAYVVTGIGVLMTPTIADTIVTAGGAGAMTKMKSAAGKMASSAKTAVLAVKTGGASAAAATAKSAAAGSASGRVQEAMKNGTSSPSPKS